MPFCILASFLEEESCSVLFIAYVLLGPSRTLSSFISSPVSLILLPHVEYRVQRPDLRPVPLQTLQEQRTPHTHRTHTGSFIQPVLCSGSLGACWGWPSSGPLSAGHPFWTEHHIHPGPGSDPELPQTQSYPKTQTQCYPRA